jgi:hypothetical protein
MRLTAGPPTVAAATYSVTGYADFGLGSTQHIHKIQGLR